MENGKVVNYITNDLSFEISGSLGSKNYSLNFIITKNIEEYKNIKNGEKLVIRSNEIADGYINVNDKTYLDLIVEIDVYRINDDLLFSIVFKEHDNNYFGCAEVEINLNEIKLQ